MRGFFLLWIASLLVNVQISYATEPKSQQVENRNHQPADLSQFFVLVDGADGKPIVNYPYKIVDCKGKKVAEGKTDREGKTAVAISTRSCAALPNKGLKLKVEDETTLWEKESLLWGKK